MRSLKNPLVISLCLSILVIATATGRASNFADGDIIFHRSTSQQSQAIAAATKSQLTHVGIIFHENGSPYVYEAVQPVKKTRLNDFIRRGKSGKYVVRRLKDTSKVDFSALKREVTRYLNRNYDSYFDWSDSKIYCSELIWKAYQRSCGLEIGRLKQLKDFNLTSSAAKSLMKKRYGNKIPREMKVIAPVDIYRSPLLKTVAKK